MTASVLVTGTSGLVGSAVARALTTSGRRVIGVDARPGPFTRVVRDLRGLDVAGLVESVDCVVHVAALHAPHVGERSMSEFSEVNVGVTAALLAASRAAGVARFVFTSTTSVYGAALLPGTEAVWVDETLRAEPRDVYDETKLAAEHLVKAAHDDAMDTITLRIGRCFPEPRHVVARHRLHRGVDVRDVAQAYVQAIESRLDHHVVVNIAGPRVFAREDCSELLVDAASVTDRRVPGLRQAFARRAWPFPPTIDRVYDSTLAGSTLGYQPTYDTWSVLAPTQ